MAKVQVPSIGRIVHYVLGPPNTPEHRPAIIVHVWGPSDPHSSVQLQVFTDGNGDRHNDRLPNVVWVTSVTHDQKDKKAGTWHWPEPVPPVEEGE